MNTTTDTPTDEVSRYLTELREALADLSPADRDGLLEDLPAHLAEVAAEAPGELADRLGPPARYAAELRTAAGLEPGPADGGGPALTSAAQTVFALATRLDRQAGRLLGYPRGSDFVLLLRPAWWVLRGYLAAILVTHLYQGYGYSPVPRFGGGVWPGLVLVLAFVVGSIRLGRRTGAGLGVPARVAVILLNVVLAVFGLSLVPRVLTLGWASPVDVQVVDRYGGVTDLYPYGPDGKPLSGVRIVDQNGNPLRMGDPYACPTQYPWTGETYQYPLCPPQPSGYAPSAPSLPLPSGANATPTFVTPTGPITPPTVAPSG